MANQRNSGSRRYRAGWMALALASALAGAPATAPGHRARDELGSARPARNLGLPVNYSVRAPEGIRGQGVPHGRGSGRMGGADARSARPTGRTRSGSGSGRR